MKTTINHRHLYKPGQLTFRLYFDGYFVGWEKWIERGWMYSQDGETWSFKPKYAHTLKILEEET